MNAPHPVVSSRPATYQDVIDAPPDKVAEIVGGELSLQPRPTMPHGVAASAIGGELHGPFVRGRGGPGGWWIILEPELHLGGDVLVPDWAGWRRERMPARPDGAWSDLAPDWACEVLSPSTRRLDLTSKRDAYAREGVSHLWLADPLDRTLEAFALRDDAWTLLGTLKDHDLVRLAPFDAVEFPLAALWGD